MNPVGSLLLILWHTSRSDPMFSQDVFDQLIGHYADQLDIVNMQNDHHNDMDTDTQPQRTDARDVSTLVFLFVTDNNQ